jgi:ATP-dependent DNA ligase
MRANGPMRRRYAAPAHVIAYHTPRLHRVGACPRSAPQPPSGEVWLHEIKHDGFRVIARKRGNRLRFNEH